MDKVVLILDKKEYKKKANIYKRILLSFYSDAKIYYTEYEDSLIRGVRRIRFVGFLLLHILYWIKSFLYAVRIIKKTDLESDLICINPIVGIFLGLLNKSSKVNITLCGFLFEPKKNKLYYNLRKIFTKCCLRGIDKVIVYAPNEVIYYKQLFPNTNFVFVKYGIDYDANETYKKPLPKEYVFSGGGSNRDYNTLFTAYRKVKDQINMPLVVATHPKCVEGLDTRGIDIRTDVVLETFGDLIRKSSVMVLALKDLELSVGHQVILQGLKENVQIIVNRIEAVEAYVSEDDVIFYETGNSDDLANKILDFINADEKRYSDKELYNKEYTFSCLLKRILSLNVN